MTVQRTREIFGDKIAHLSDDQVNEYISNMGLLCDSLLEEMIKSQASKLTNKHKLDNTNGRQV